MTKKLFVLDTNVLLFSSSSLKSFGKHDVVVPLSVLDELDTFKGRPDEVGKNSREVSRILYKLSREGDLRKGVKWKDGAGTITVLTYKDEPIPDEVRKDSTDNRILGLCLHLSKSGSKNVVLITKDINAILKAKILGIECQDFDEDFDYKKNGFYKNVQSINVPDSTIDDIYKHKRVQTLDSYKPNTFYVLKSTRNSKRAAFVRYTPLWFFSLVSNNKSIWGISPINMEQEFAVDLLVDDSVSLVAITGKAGVGKSLISAAAGLQKVIEAKRYRNLIITRPTIPVGKDLGYLPGTLDEKLDPWFRAFRDTIGSLFSDKDDDASDYRFRHLLSTGVIKIEPLAYIRGRSFDGSFIILDEAQNLSRHEIKTYLTRAGKGTKIVLTGDILQIDSLSLDSESNGLSQVVKRFSNEDLFGHVELTIGERSRLATISADLL